MLKNSPLLQVLYRYTEQGSASQVKGKWFETICLYFLKHEPLYRDHFESVWLWQDWPGRDGKPDTGIDIVAKIRDSEKFCAVQCKFYEPEHTISKENIDSFLAASSKEGFAERIIIATTTKWTKHAEDAIQDLQVPCVRLTLDALEQSSIDWNKFDESDLEHVSYKPAKKLRDDQVEAVSTVLEAFNHHERGKMIMACGTGKTFVSLNIACQIGGKKILVLVPSISLMNQTIIAWSADRDKNTNMIFFAVCSDETVGKKDDDDIKITDLVYPATTNSAKLIESWNLISDERKQNSITVIFSTYQSLQVIHEIQTMGFGAFDLIICDEAHRTAGVTTAKREDSNFVKVHDDEFVKSARRLYMTATPKVYADSVVKTAKEKDAVLYSMDDEKIFGPVFYELSFSKAVSLGLLSDYRVMVLGIDEGFINETLAKYLTTVEISLDDASKMVGCWKGLSKNFPLDDVESIAGDKAPMKRALAFTSTIAGSQDFQKKFASTVNAFKAEENQGGVDCFVEHVDGKMNAGERQRTLTWLREDSGENECRILSNARCLSEGVDVPALDAIMFLNPKKSRVDIVQAVGRVMRKNYGKKFGYVILPIVIPFGKTPEEALDDEKNYNVIWDVLQALRSIDDQFYIEVNNVKYDGKPGKVFTRRIGKPGKGGGDDIDIRVKFSGEWSKAVYAKLVEKCGDREYSAKWAAEMKRIAETHRRRVQAIFDNGSEGSDEVFRRYIEGLRQNINKNITVSDALDMLSQHFITKPIFDACFKDFSTLDPISKTLEDALNLLRGQGLKSETQSLDTFYARQVEQFSNINSDEGKQSFIKNIYENFFNVAFPQTAERLGIVYTPGEIVDFILRSADWALREELGISEGLSAENVAILDPFTGTGTFIVRLLQLGLIDESVLAQKYNHGIFANEILILAYYIAAVNIAMTYHAVSPGKLHELFPGIVLTDTFNEKNGQQITYIFSDNSKKAIAEREAPIKVIIGNPPYSVGQSSANDNNKNLKYEELDGKIRMTYAAESTATNINSLYDSYIRAIRWATDRLVNYDYGVVCYVTNGSFIDSNSADGLRKCLCDDFQSIYIFNLRGNQYTSGELSKKEGGKIFGSGSRLPVAITLFVKKPHAKGQKCRIFYRDIGDYLSREAKLNEISRSVSFGKMLSEMTEIFPNSHGDWINHRNELFASFMRLGSKKHPGEFAIFDERYSRGVLTGRDAWCCNFSREALKRNMTAMIDVYTAERKRWSGRSTPLRLPPVSPLAWGDEGITPSSETKELKIEDFVTMDPRKISWSNTLLKWLNENITLNFSESRVVTSLYRPFTKSNLYFDRYLNEANYRMPSIFPAPSAKNLVIGVSGIGSKKGFSALMTDCVPDIQLLFNGQCFPLYWYEFAESKPEERQGNLFSAPSQLELPSYVRRDAISDEALLRFRQHYHDRKITKEDIFYYVYGVLSSPEYRERFGVDVFKELARVPFAKNFWAFSGAGRRLGDLHVNYEDVDVSDESGIRTEGLDLRVSKMRIAERFGEKIIRYNDDITISGISPDAWHYVVKGKSALEWIVERYQDTTDKDSGLRNDCNAWGNERGESDYILKLIGRVERVSVETVKILRGLPELGV
ncbi:MAG: DEAD/DEAH box helicase [Synergistaceae bacterium]|nr:DEAD/DEAH box helicase [Synergistaceae bacterium]